MIPQKDFHPGREAEKDSRSQRQQGFEVTHASTARGASIIWHPSALGQFLVSSDYEHERILREVPEMVAAEGYPVERAAKIAARLIASAWITPWASGPLVGQWKQEFYDRRFVWAEDGKTWTRDQAEKIWTDALDAAEPLLDPDAAAALPALWSRWGTLWPKSAFDPLIATWDLEETPLPVDQEPIRPPVRPAPVRLGDRSTATPSPRSAHAEEASEFERVPFLLGALSTGLSGGQARVLDVLSRMVSSKGEICVSQSNVGLAASMTWCSDAIRTGADLIGASDWVVRLPGTYRLQTPRSAPITTFKTHTGQNVGFVDWSHDAWRDGSPLSSCAGLVLLMTLTEGPWPKKNLAQALGVSSETVRKGCKALAEAGFAEVSTRRVERLLPIEDWPLDAVAEKAGTAGRSEQHREQITKSRARSEPLRQRLLEERKEDRALREKSDPQWKQRDPDSER